MNKITVGIVAVALAAAAYFVLRPDAPDVATTAPAVTDASSDAQGPAAVSTAFSGNVKDEQGQPVSSAMVTLSGASFDGAETLSVFTGADGRYSIGGIGLRGALEGVKVAVRKVGYEVVSASNDAGAGSLESTILVKALDNVAAQVPPSAWLKDMPDGQERRVLVSLCGNACHGFPTAKVITFAAGLESMPKDTLHDVWLNEALSMKQRYGLIFPKRVKHAPVMSADMAESAYDLFGRDILKTFTPLLVEHMPRSFSNFPAKDFDYGAPLGVTAGTVMREYPMPADSLIRELDLLPGDKQLWAVDYRRGMLVGIDRDSGAQRWVKIPGDDPGPHTIAPTTDGKLLIALMDYPALARFDPQTEKFELFNTPPRTDIHDIALDHLRRAVIDHEGRAWLTFAASNQLASLDMKTGDIKRYDAPLSNGKVPQNIGIYSAAVTSDGKHLWYTQLFGGVGSFNLETKKFEHYLEFPYGDSPHRMAISDRDVVYVPLSGAGEVVAIDGRSGDILRRYRLPDINSSPYNLSWDETRRLLWIGTSSTDVFYTLDPESGKFAVFPLPRQETFFRMITVDHATGDIWASYSNYLPPERAPAAVIRITPGDR